MQYAPLITNDRRHGSRLAQNSKHRMQCQTAERWRCTYHFHFGFCGTLTILRNARSGAPACQVKPGH
eukprot:3738650-Prymnesium_polylepis.2